MLIVAQHQQFDASRSQCGYIFFFTIYLAYKNTVININDNLLNCVKSVAESPRANKMDSI